MLTSRHDHDESLLRRFAPLIAITALVISILALLLPLLNMLPRAAP